MVCSNKATKFDCYKTMPYRYPLSLSLSFFFCYTLPLKKAFIRAQVAHGAGA